MTTMLIRYAARGELWVAGRGSFDAHPDGSSPAGFYMIPVAPEEFADCAGWQGPYDSEVECRVAAEAYSRDCDAQAARNEFDCKVYDQQYDLIAKECGNKAAQDANYGWGTDGNDIYVSIATKVYGHGVLCSEGTYATGEIRHSWR